MSSEKINYLEKDYKDVKIDYTSNDIKPIEIFISKKKFGNIH